MSVCKDKVVKFPAYPAWRRRYPFQLCLLRLWIQQDHCRRHIKRTLRLQ